MKPRTPEAARLEADYLARVREALGSRRESEAGEIVQSIVEHIEEAVAELKGPEVTLVQMAQVLERLGPPRTFSEGSEPPPQERKPGGRLPSDASHRFVLLLDRIWVASLVSVVGLYIPIIDLYFCMLAGHGMLARALRRPEELPRDFQSLARLCRLVVIVGLVHVPLAIWAMAQPLAGILTLPTGAVLACVPVVIYWKLLGGVSSMLVMAGQDRLASATLDARRVGITIAIVMTVIAIVLGVTIGVAHLGVNSDRNRLSQELATVAVGFGLLPIHWVVSYFFLLRPISRARKALAEPSSVVEAGLAQQH